MWGKYFSGMKYGFPIWGKYFSGMKYGFPMWGKYFSGMKYGFSERRRVNGRTVFRSTDVARRVSTTDERGRTVDRAAAVHCMGDCGSKPAMTRHGRRKSVQPRHCGLDPQSPIKEWRIKKTRIIRNVILILNSPFKRFLRIGSPVLPFR
jgi:hypothetical protein